MEETLNLQENNDTSVFSFFNAPVNIREKQPIMNCTIKDVLHFIRGEQYKSMNEELITLDEKQQHDYKNAKLDFVTFSGTFSHRSIDGLIKRSKYFCVDIEHIGDTEKILQLTEQIHKNLTPAMMFISPEHNGLKVVLCIDPGDGTHKEYYKTIETWFNNMVLSGFTDISGNPLKIDFACKNVCRATFLPHDPDCYYSEKPTIINRAYVETFIREQPAIPPREYEISSDIIKDVLKMIRKSVNGQQHILLLRAGILTGEFIAGGFIEEDEAIDVLENEICKKEILDFELAQKTIRQGIAYGKTKPISQNKISQKKKQITVPPFPVDGLPEQMQFLINTYSETYGTHPDFWAGAFLLATSLGIGQSVKLKTKYTNAPCLWLIFIAPSGVGKTEPLKVALAPFLEIDKRNYVEHKEYEQWKALNKEEREDIKLEQPSYIQYALSDFTPESMVSVHSDNPRGIIIYRDELSGWIKDFNRYNKSGEQENYLSAFMGNPFVVNRKGQMLRIDEPFINVSGGLQPGLISHFAKDNRDRNGFLVRFCHIFPDNAEKPVYKKKIIPDEVKQQYTGYIKNLLSVPYNPDSPEYIYLSEDAFNMYIDWFDENARATNQAKHDFLRGVYSKLDIISLRLALTIHFSKWAFTGLVEETITQATMKAALEITEYFRATGTKLLYHLQPSVDKAISIKEVARFLSELGNSQNQIAEVLKCTRQNVHKFIN